MGDTDHEHREDEEVTVVVENGGDPQDAPDAASDAAVESGTEDAVESGTEDAVEDEAPGSGEPPWWRRLRVRRTWAEVRPTAPFTVFSAWVAVVLLVAIARVDPWNEWRSWRKWLKADERGWELVIPGLLAAVATWLFLKAHDRWSEERWSPEALGMVLLGTAAGTGALLWGLYALGLRPFAA